MTAQYDWSKLPKGWRYHKDARYGDEHITDPSGKTYNVATWMYYEHCRDALRSCRIPEPPPSADTATVTALRPADEYDWSRLEGSGWFHGKTSAHGYIEKSGLLGWTYWYAKGEKRLSIMCASQSFDAKDALETEQEAERLVAKCKRDWRDEVKQACEGLLGFTIEWHASQDQRAILWWEVNVPSDGLTLTAKRTYRVRCHTTNAESLLTMSLIIERLKKLGWREA